jgi:hypothetical protein
MIMDKFESGPAFGKFRPRRIMLDSEGIEAHDYSADIYLIFRMDADEQTS